MIHLNIFSDTAGCQNQELLLASNGSESEMLLNIYKALNGPPNKELSRLSVHSGDSKKA